MGGEQLIAFSWYRVGGHYTANTYVAKLWELVERLTFSDLGSEKFTVVANVPADRGGDGVIQGFVDDYLAATEAALASGLRE